MKKLAQVMGFEYSDKDSYTESVLEPYHGIYWEYSDGTLEADSLIYLENDDTRLSEVSGIQDQSSLVYDPERFCELDGYNIFLSGSQPLLTIKCPSASSEKRLVIFRDSFASSLAPLLTGSYSEITLIDLRYIPSSMLSEYIEFTDQDVLFMLSSTLFNRATLMR